MENTYGIKALGGVITIIFKGDCWKSDEISFTFKGMTNEEIRSRIQEEAEKNKKTEQTDKDYRLNEILSAVDGLNEIASNMEWGGDYFLSRKLYEYTEKIQHHVVRLKHE
jgi:hypothetical protein